MAISQTSSARRPVLAVLVPVAGAVAAVAAMVWAGQPWRDGSPSLPEPFALFMVGFAVLPHVLVAIALVSGRAVAWLWWSALGYGVLGSAAGILVDIGILTSDSSTAALGFLFLPVYQLLGMIPVVGGAALIGLWSRRRDRRGT